jgi:hypothetical protein
MNSLVVGRIRCKKSVEMLLIAHDARNKRHEGLFGSIVPPSLDEHPS